VIKFLIFDLELGLVLVMDLEIVVEERELIKFIGMILVFLILLHLESLAFL